MMMDDVTAKLAEAKAALDAIDQVGMSYEQAVAVEAACARFREALAAYEQAQAEPVGEVVEMDDGCRVAVWRDGTPEPGTKLYAALEAEAKPAPAGCVLVDRGALQMVRLALQRDADDGRTVRGEMLSALDNATHAAPAAPAPITRDEARALLIERAQKAKWPGDPAPAAPAEPVAWRVDAGYFTKFESIPDSLRGNAVPLYAAPAAPAPAWQPIETAPKDFFTEFDGWNGERVPDVSWAHPQYAAKDEYDWCISVYEAGFGWVNERVKGLTHWMPLPQPPKENNHD